AYSNPILSRGEAAMTMSMPSTSEKSSCRQSTSKKRNKNSRLPTEQRAVYLAVCTVTALALSACDGESSSTEPTASNPASAQQTPAPATNAVDADDISGTVTG